MTALVHLLIGLGRDTEDWGAEPQAANGPRHQTSPPALGWAKSRFTILFEVLAIIVRFARTSENIRDPRDQLRRAMHLMERSGDMPHCRIPQKEYGSEDEFLP